jgi:ABC-type nitrate/sulfonate/bicarbonate transport system substrate-binding protein
MDKIHFPYRASSHLALMHVIAECGAFERQNLDVEYQKQIDREEAHRLVPTGEVEFVSGNHVSTYAARARGDQWVYVGQTMSDNKIALVTRQDAGIDRLKDVRFRKFGSRGRHPMLNTWLYLKQNGLDPDLGQVEIVRTLQPDVAEGKRSRKSLQDMVADKDIDACFLSEPATEKARRMGLKVIEIAPQAMINYMTMSTSKKLVDTRPDIVERVLRAVIDGIAFYKQNREAVIKILLDKFDGEIGKLDRAGAERVYDSLAPNLDPRLYPTLEAVGNVYQEAVKQDKDAARIHPMALWDMHFLRKIDDSGFIADLYKNNTHLLTSHGG